MKNSIISLVLITTIPCAVAESKYLESGVSATSREWRAEDYNKLASLVAQNTVPLPDMKDEEGAKVLQRFCSIENLAYGRNKTLPLESRMQDAMQIQSAVSTLGKIYASKAVKGEKIGDESALLMGMLLDLATLQIELVNEFIPSIKRDASYEFRMKGLKDFQTGLATVFVGAYSAVAEDPIFTDKNRSDILAKLAINSQRFSTVLQQDVKSEMILKYTKLKEKMKEPKDNESIIAILASLNG